MSTNSKVGVVVLLGLLLGAWFILRIENIRVGREVGARYRVHIGDAQGLRARSPVSLHGVRVGQVTTLKLDGDEVKLELLLDPDIRLHQGATASVASVGLLGEKELKLTSGQLDQPQLGKGEVIEGTVAVSLDDVIAKLGRVGDNVVAITGTLKTAVGSDLNQEKVRDLLGSISGVVVELREVIGENEDSIRRTAASLEQFATSSARVARHLEAATAGTGGSGDSGDRMAKLPELVERLNETAKNLEEISAKINKGQGTIGQLVDNPATAQKLQTTLDSVQGGVKNLSGVMSTAVELGLRGDFLTDREQAKGFFSVDVRPPGPGFLRLGIVAEPFSLSGQQTVLSDTNGTVTTTRQQELSSRIAFSGLLGWRYRFLVGRGGVIESRPGLGLDVLLLQDRLRVSGDIWDFGRQGFDPHARAELAFTVYRALYVTGGWDEFLNTRQRIDSVFVGAGVQFKLLGD